MPRVYVINKGSHDFSDASRFGHLVFLSEGQVNRFATGKMYRQFAEALAKSSPKDYILPTGLSIMTAIACAIFARKHGKLNLLLFKTTNKSSTYLERKMDLDQLLEVLSDEEK